MAVVGGTFAWLLARQEPVTCTVLALPEPRDLAVLRCTTQGADLSHAVPFRFGAKLTQG